MRPRVGQAGLLRKRVVLSERLLQGPAMETPLVAAAEGSDRAFRIGHPERLDQMVVRLLAGALQLDLPVDRMLCRVAQVQRLQGQPGGVCSQQTLGYGQRDRIAQQIQLSPKTVLGDLVEGSCDIHTL